MMVNLMAKAKRYDSDDCVKDGQDDVNDNGNDGGCRKL